MPTPKKKAPPVSAAPAKKATNSVNSFRESHVPDVAIPAKIRAGFAKMRAQAQAWYYQGDFARIAGVKPSDLNDYVAHFQDQVHELPGARGKVVWFVSADAKAKALAPPDQE